MCAVEAKRGCGYRVINGLYLVGGGMAAACDRLPMPLVPCEVCGQEPHFTRGIMQVNPLMLWGPHIILHYDDREIDLENTEARWCQETNCPLCRPCERAFMMWVGTEYTERSFIDEAYRMGVSKRIPAIPKNLVVGQDWVYLAKMHIIPGTGQFRMLEGSRAENNSGPGVFYAFKPHAIQKIITQSDADAGEVYKLAEQGIEAVVVPDEDPDHNPKGRRGTEK